MNNEFRIEHESYSTDSEKLEEMRELLAQKSPVEYCHREDVLDLREVIRDIILDIANCHTRNGKMALIASAYDLVDVVFWNAAFVKHEKK